MSKRHTTPSKIASDSNCRQKCGGGEKKQDDAATESIWWQDVSRCSKPCAAAPQCEKDPGRVRPRRNQHYVVTIHSTGGRSCLIPCGGRKVWGSQTSTIPLAKATQNHDETHLQRNNEKADRMHTCTAGFASRSGRTPYTSKSPSIATLNASTGPPRLSLWARRQRCRDMHRISANTTRLFTQQSQPFSCRFPSSLGSCSLLEQGQVKPKLQNYTADFLCFGSLWPLIWMLQITLDNLR